MPGKITGGPGTSKMPTIYLCFLIVPGLTSTLPTPTAPLTMEEVPSSEMNLVCIDRHSGYVNTLFIDCTTVRKVGLKELWTLKWHRTFDNKTNVWTKGGGVQPEDWPEWMRGLKDY